MTETYVLNFYPIFKMIIAILAVVGGYSTINNIAHILGRFGKDKLDNKKDIHAKDCDTDIVQDLIQKFPLVKQEFINKNTIEQNVENNQEIHEINKRLEVIEELVQKLGKKKK